MQLLELGVTRRQIARRVASGEYRRLHLGVYLLLPFPLRYSHDIAAVLACGPGAAISHESGVYLYKLLPHPAVPGPIHVTVQGTHVRRLDNVVTHRSSLRHWEIRERQSIPVTSPVRTLVDFAGGDSTDADLEAAVSEAIALRLTTRDALARRLPAGRRGVRRLRELLDAGPKRTRSQPERVLLGAFRAAGIDGFLTNRRLGRWEVDFYWPEHELALEVDGYAAHSSPTAFERDHRKEAGLAETGVTLRRVSALQVRDELGGVVELVRRALSTT